MNSNNGQSPLKIALHSIYCFIAFLLARPTFALSPFIEWEQIETPHFRVIFDSRHRELGRQYAFSAEEAFAQTAPLFGVWPDKTTLLLNDSSDLANGSATGLPYPLIIAHPVLPSPQDSISDYGHWGLELVTHEYVHILNFEPATGIMRPLRYVFGTIVRPNMLLPRWYSEGLAVEMETRLSSHGRLRSPNYLSTVRALVSEDKLAVEDIARINEVSIPDWVGGLRPYLMGALVMNEIGRLGGPEIFKELNFDYSRRLPFFINGPVEERLGLNYSQLLEKAYERAEHIVRRQLETIEKGGKVEETLLVKTGFFNHRPVVSKDGKKLAIIGKAHNVESYVSIIERQEAESPFPELISGESEAPAFNFDGTAINRLSWTPNGDALVFDKVDVTDRYYLYSDIWRYDLASKKVRRLTRGLRAREPAVSPDGQMIVFVRLTPGSSQLAAMKIDGSEIATLYEPPFQTRISNPEFLSQNEIIFAEKHDGGDEVLRVLKLPSPEAPRTVLERFKPAGFPRLTEEGLVFVSTRSGVANLYLADRDLKNARAITNSRTRVFNGDIDPVTGDLLYSQLTSKGAVIYRSPKQSWSRLPAAPPNIDPVVDTQWPELRRPKTELKTQVEPYSPWSYLLPRYWLPYAYFAPGIAYFSAATSAADPTGRHSYAFSAAYDTLTEAPSLYGAYLNHTTRVPISLIGYNTNEYIYSSSIRRQTTDLIASGSFYIPKLNNDWRGNLGWIHSYSEVGRRSLLRNGVEASIRYSNVKQRGLEISPEKGSSFALGYRRFLPSVSDHEYDVTTFSGATFFSSRLLPKRHAIALFGNLSYAPRLQNAVFGTSTISGSYQTLPGLRNVVMRGYNSGVFIGRSLAAATAEYRFPINYEYRGRGTLPFFFQRWHAAFFVDTLTLDGWVYNYNSKQYDTAWMGNFYFGTGFEAKLDATIFYHLPIQFTLGLYYGEEASANPAGIFPFFSIGI